MYKVEIKFKASDWGFMDVWLNENISKDAYSTNLGTHHPIYDVYCFDYEEDAMAFKLMWS